MTVTAETNNDVAPFELTTFLSGPTKAWGIFEDRFGRVRRRFDVDMHGSWHNDTFKLDERFTYDDGRIEHRIWLITTNTPGRFEATSDDCIGGARGVCTTDTVHMTYTFRLRLPSRIIVVDIDDRLHRIDAHSAINRATVRKWGVRLGEITLFFARPEKRVAPRTFIGANRVAAK